MAPVMVNFTHQLGWTISARGICSNANVDVLVKVIFKMRWTFKQQTLSKADYDPSLGWVSSNQLKVFREKQAEIPRKRKFCPWTAFRLKLQHQLLFSRSSVCWPALQIWDLPASIITWTLKNKSPNLSHFFLFLWRTLTSTTPSSTKAFIKIMSSLLTYLWPFGSQMWLWSRCYVATVAWTYGIPRLALWLHLPLL